MITTETIKQTVSVEERAAHLANSVGGVALLHEMAARHGLNEGLTFEETVAMSTVLFGTGKEPGTSDIDGLNPYAKVRAGFLLVDIRTRPEPHNLALASLFKDLKHLRDTSELLS